MTAATNGHFRSIFHQPGRHKANRSKILRILWREHPQATLEQIRAKFEAMGYRCADALIRQARHAVHTEPNKPEEYTLDEIRAVRHAAEQCGGLCRLAALVTELVELREELLASR